MLWRDVVELATKTYDQSGGGTVSEVDVFTQVFANKKSVRQTEFYQVAASGQKPSYMFEVRSSEYNGEESLRFENNIYPIIRTYSKNGEITELVCAGIVATSIAPEVS